MKAKYLALDIESGGLDSIVNTVLEYYFIVLDEDFNELDSLHLLTKPDDRLYKVNAKALEVNNINLVEHDKIAVAEREAKPILYDFLKKNTDDGKDKLIWLGHNVNFDRDAVFNNLLTRQTCDKFCKYYTLDTGTLAQFLKVCGVLPDDIGGSLAALLAYYRVDGSNSHRAEDDIRATIKVIIEMKESIEDLQSLVSYMAGKLNKLD